MRRLCWGFPQQLRGRKIIDSIQSLDSKLKPVQKINEQTVIGKSMISVFDGIHSMNSMLGSSIDSYCWANSVKSMFIGLVIHKEKAYWTNTIGREASATVRRYPANGKSCLLGLTVPTHEHTAKAGKTQRKTSRRNSKTVRDLNDWEIWSPRIFGENFDGPKLYFLWLDTIEHFLEDLVLSSDSELKARD